MLPSRQPSRYCHKTSATCNCAAYRINRSFLILCYLLTQVIIGFTQPVDIREAPSSFDSFNKSSPDAQSYQSVQVEHQCTTADSHHPVLEDKSLREKSVTLPCQKNFDHSSTRPPDHLKVSKESKKIDISKFFREEVENYPEEEIISALRRTSSEFKEVHNVINTPLDPNMNLTERTASSHNDEASGEESVCRSVLRNIYPREAKRDDSLVYVPNTQDFMQVIQAEICQSPNEECSYLQDNLPYGMQSICIQKYSYKKLLFLDPLEKRMASDLFRYPSCCSCHVRRGAIDLRSNLSPNVSSPKSIRKNVDAVDDDAFAHSISQQGPASKQSSGAPDSIQSYVDQGNLTKVANDNQTAEQTQRQPKNLRLDSSMETVVTRSDQSNFKVTTRAPNSRKPGGRAQTTPNPTTRIRSTPRQKQEIDHYHSTVILQADKVYTPSNVTDK